MKTRDFIYLSKTTKIMKTGGTLNFLKKAGAILMLLAIFASSCNKYADDFDQINTKLDALAASVAGVAQLNTDMSALKTQVTAIQTAIASLPTTSSVSALATSLTAITTKIDAITTTLGTVATNGTATKAVVDQLKIDLGKLSDKVTADNATLLASDVSQSADIASIVTANTSILTQIAALQTSLDALTGSAADTDATALTIKGLQLMLDAQKVMLEKLLANSNMISDNVSITSDAEVTFYMTKIGQWIGGGMIQGTLLINTTNITSAKLAELKTITDNIIAVIGVGTATITSTATTSLSKPLTFAKLSATTGNLTVSAQADVSFPLLTNVGGSYTVTGKDVSDDLLGAVTGNVVLDYDGGYVQPGLLTVGGDLKLVEWVTGGTNTNVGTLTVDLSGLTSVASLHTGADAAGTLSLTSTTSVNVGQALVSTLVAPAATTVNLAYTGPSAGIASAISVQAGTAASSITVGAKKLLSDLTITGSATSTVALPALVSVAGNTAITAKTLTAASVTTLTGTVGLTSVTPVNLPVLATSGAITAASAVTFTAPVLNTPSMTFGTVLTALEVGTTSGTAEISGTGSAFVTLTVDALAEAMTVPAAVKTATIFGKNATTYAGLAGTVSATSNTLVTLTLGGVLKSATVTSTGLTALHTSGVVNSLTVNGCTNTALTSLDLMHTHYVGGPGSDLTITGNTKLTSLTTSTDMLHALVVTGNTSLAAMNFASYVNLLNHDAANTGGVGGPWDIAVSISNNALVGSFTAAVAATPTTPYAEAVIHSADLSTLKAYLLSAMPATGATLTYVIAMDVDDVDATTAGLQGLAAAMTANDAVSTAIVGGGIDVKTELAILVP